jgi:hypothetical protein
MARCRNFRQVLTKRIKELISHNHILYSRLILSTINLPIKLLYPIPKVAQTSRKRTLKRLESNMSKTM